MQLVLNNHHWCAKFPLVSNPMVAEAAVVGANDDLTGQAIVAFVILRQGSKEGPETVKDLRNHYGTSFCLPPCINNWGSI